MSSRLAKLSSQLCSRILLAKPVCNPDVMSAPKPTQEQWYERIAALRAKLDEIDRQRAAVMQNLHEVIHQAFPENRGEGQKRGVLANVSRCSGYTREHVAQIRDGKAVGGKPRTVRAGEQAGARTDNRQEQ